MNHLAIIRVTAMLLAAMGALYLLCCLVAVAFAEFDEMTTLMGAGLTLIVISTTILLLTDRSVRRTSAVDGLAVAIVFWAILPIPASVPFFEWSDIAAPVSAYFEAVSCLTTTGFSLTVDPGRPLPTSYLFWRAILHSAGAIASITIAVTVLSALNLGGPGIHRSHLFTLKDDDFFKTVPRVVRISTTIVVASILVLFSVLLMSGAAPRDAASWAVSAISTGLVDPASSELNLAMTSIQSNLIFLGLIFGTVGFLVVDNLISGKVLKALQDPETLGLFFGVLTLTFLVFLAGIPFFQAMGWSLSSLSTSGIALSDSARFERIPLTLVLLPVLIGGSALSAAGGIKLGRLIVLLRRSGLEFLQLGYRGSIQRFRYRGRYQSEETVMGVWVYLVGYVIASVIGILIFSMAGLEFDSAIRSAIGALSNAGHVIELTDTESSEFVQIGIAFGMILGRLEVIALLPALNINFWRS